MLDVNEIKSVCAELRGRVALLRRGYNFRRSQPETDENTAGALRIYRTLKIVVPLLRALESLLQQPLRERGTGSTAYVKRYQALDLAITNSVRSGPELLKELTPLRVLVPDLNVPQKWTIASVQELCSEQVAMAKARQLLVQQVQAGRKAFIDSLTEDQRNYLRDAAAIGHAQFFQREM